MIKKILTLPLRVAKKLVGAVTGGGRERPAPGHSRPNAPPKSWTPPTPSTPKPRTDEDDRGHSHSHSHGHSHDHGHSHGHEPEPPAPEPTTPAPVAEAKPAPTTAAAKPSEPKPEAKPEAKKPAPKKAAPKKAAAKKPAAKKPAPKKAAAKKPAPKKAAASKPAATKHGDVKAQGIDTPNPNAMKFELSKKCFDQPVSVATRDGADSDWTKAVFAVVGVRTLFAVNDFVTVTKEDTANWANLTGPIVEALESNL